MKKWPFAMMMFVLATFVCASARADELHVMTKEQLRPMLGKAEVIVIDVRTNYDWDKSKEKIKGAVREEGMKFASWINKYPKDKTIVFYCA